MNEIASGSESEPRDAAGAPARDLARPRRIARLSLSGRWISALIGVLLLALYLLLLARKDIDDLMGRGELPALPGGWKAPAALIVAGLGALGIAAARQAGWRWARVRELALQNAELTAMGAILLGALGLRVFGISDNLPYINHPDEPAVADKALRILQTGDFNPHYFVYPSLYYYMLAALDVVRFFALVSSGSAVRLDQLDPTDFYLWGRLLTALLGTLTVLLVYLAARRLYGPLVGVVAAAFMATSSLHVLNSQFITTDAPATFFTALAFFAIARLLPPLAEADDGRRTTDDGDPGTASRQPLAIGDPPQALDSSSSVRRPSSVASQVRVASIGAYLAAGAAVGLAAGTKYNSVLVFLPLLVAHAIAVWPSGGPRAFFDRRLGVAFGAMIAAFFLSTPFALFDLSNFLNDVASVLTHYRTGHTGFEGDANWRYYVPQFLSTDPLPTALALAGVVLAFVRHRPADVLVLVFPLALYFSMSGYRVNFDRNLVPLLPFTSILAALPMAALLDYLLGRATSAGRGERNDRLRWVGYGVLALAVLLAVWPATAAAVQRGYRQTQPDNRLRAARWLDENTRPGTKVWLEPLTPPLNEGRYLQGHGEHVTEHPLAWYMENRYEYLVVSAGAYKDVVYDHPDKDPALRDAYLRFFSENEPRLAASFEANKIDHPGPSILIYRTGYEPPVGPEDVQAGHAVDGLFREDGGNGATVRLIGADFPPTAEADGVLPLVLYWMADRPMTRDFTVFVHLVDRAGARPAQRDTGPRNGTYGTSLWSPGEVVVDEADLNLPEGLPPGEYTLRAGLYLQSDGHALPAFTVTSELPSKGKDYVDLGVVTVGKP